MKTKHDYIAIEGTDGSGKSTLITQLTQVIHNARRVTDLGGNEFGQWIRTCLLTNPHLSSEVQLHLLTAARVDLMEKTILPWLHGGDVVLSDRSCYSTCVYQYLLKEPLMGDTMPEETLLQFVNRVTSSLPLVPDAVIWVRVDEETRLERLKQHASDAIINKVNLHQLDQLYAEVSEIIQREGIPWYTVTGNVSFEEQCEELHAQGFFVE